MNTAQKIAKESIISFTGIFYGSLNRYLYSALLARWVGPEYLGIYSMANAIMLISEVLSKMGMETGVMRFISRLDPINDRNEISKIIKASKKGIMIGDSSLIGAACTFWQQLAIGNEASWVEAMEKPQEQDAFLKCVEEKATELNNDGKVAADFKPGFGLKVNENKLLSTDLPPPGKPPGCSG